MSLIISIPIINIFEWQFCLHNLFHLWFWLSDFYLFIFIPFLFYCQIQVISVTTVGFSFIKQRAPILSRSVFGWKLLNLRITVTHSFSYPQYDLHMQGQMTFALCRFLCHKSRKYKFSHLLALLVVFSLLL